MASSKRTPQDQVRSESEEDERKHNYPPVVALGASAGGLSALREFFSALPRADSGIAFVVITHLDPVHTSHMAELLGRCSDLPTREARDQEPLHGGHIYVIPPGKTLTVADGRMQLAEMGKRPAMPIDFFLRSLASEAQEQATAILLSGTGDDGVLGIRDIKAAGGLVLAQDPETAEHDPMPRNAIGTGLVDHVAPPKEMPGLLLDYYDRRVKEVMLPSEQAEDQLNKILTLLYARGEQDFHYYKRNTLLRRIGRRMALNHVGEIAAYVDFLQEHPDEVRQLAKDLLISVTSFFRDPEAWIALHDSVLAEVVKRKLPAQPIRAWVAGCATGEEAYSLAMLLIEEAERHQYRGKIQVFATDVDPAALEIGRVGLYTGNLDSCISPERLRRFFNKLGASYQVKKELRETVLFAPQNLISDSPFSRLDIITCRNMLIYFELELQKKIMGLFHFALVGHGALMLGTSETVPEPQLGLFLAVNKKYRIYRRTGQVRLTTAEIPAYAPANRGTRRIRVAGDAGLSEIVLQTLLTHYAPASVLINREFRALYFFGRTDEYITQPAGEPTSDVLSMAGENIRTKLRAAVHRTVATGKPVTVGGAEIKRGERTVALEISAMPVTIGDEQLILASFREQVPGVAAVVSGARESTDDADVIRQLEDELRRSKEELHSTIEELEASNEELKVANEEAMSMNEELQSANEELEAAKEELQSLNEELTTMNNQLEVKIGELEITSNDFHNLLGSTNIATIFLDKELHIKRYTPSTARLLHLIPGDVGRPVSDIAGRCRDPHLLADAHKVLDTLIPVEKEVTTETNEWYIRRAQPYRTQDQRIDGVVITYFDITERKRREEDQARLAAIVESSSDAVIGKSVDGRVMSWNAAAERVFGYPAVEAIGRPMSFLLPPGVPNEFPGVIDRLRRGERVDTFESIRRRKDGVVIYVAVTASAIRDAAGAVIGFSDIERDVSERRRTEQMLREQKEQLAEADRRKDEFLAVLGHELRNPLATISNTVNALKNQELTADPQRVQWGVGMVERQTARLMHLVDDLLDVVRITRGKVDLRATRVNLNTLIEDAIQGMRPLLDDRKLELKLDLPKVPVWLEADPIRLAQVFTNLLANAAWYTEHAGTIDIAVSQADGHANVRVRDTGIGMPPELLPHIFNIFTQGPEARNKKEKGLGIGLTLVRQLVELHGGRVVATSEGLGKGSEFTVELPLNGKAR